MLQIACGANSGCFWLTWRAIHAIVCAIDTICKKRRLFGLKKLRTIVLEEGSQTLGAVHLSSDLPPSIFSTFAIHLLLYPSPLFLNSGEKRVGMMEEERRRLREMREGRTGGGCKRRRYEIFYI